MPANTPRSQIVGVLANLVRQGRYTLNGDEAAKLQQAIQEGFKLAAELEKEEQQDEGENTND